jgi:hypothetical protein
MKEQYGVYKTQIFFDLSMYAAAKAVDEIAEMVSSPIGKGYAAENLSILRDVSRDLLAVISRLEAGPE